MTFGELNDCLERAPVIAAVHDEALWQHALTSPVEVLFDLKSNLNTVSDRIGQAHNAGKRVFVHLDLADGIGKDRAGVEFLSRCGADGIISTRSQIVRHAREAGLLAVQRCFMLDSQGAANIGDLLGATPPDLLEIMPGVIGKMIERFAGGQIPVIAGGLIETKAEVTMALRCGALAVSTGKKELWFS